MVHTAAAGYVLSLQKPSLHVRTCSLPFFKRPVLFVINLAHLSISPLTPSPPYEPPTPMAEKDRLQAFVRDIEDWFYSSSNDLEGSIKAFSQEHAAAFKGAEGDAEQQLGFMEKYKQFYAIVETKLEAFAASKGFSMEDFAALAQQAKESDEVESSVIDIIISVSDYETFSMMMAQQAEA